MKKYFKLFAYNALILAVLIALMELSCSILLDVHHFWLEEPRVKNDQRAILPHYKDHPWAKKHFDELNEINAEYQSYIGWRRKNFKGQTIQIDSIGIRKTIQSAELSDSMPLAIFLGGSTIWGDGVNTEHTIPSLFSSLYPGNYLVKNYGESGYSAYQSLQFLQLRLLDGIQPSLVISYDGVNNSPAHLNKPFAHSREQQIITEMKGADAPPPYKAYLLQSTRQFLNKIRNRFFPKTLKSNQEIPQFSPKQNQAAATELLESWLLLKEQCDKINAQFLCVLQPNVFVSNPNYESSRHLIQHHLYQNGYVYYDIVLEMINTKKYEALKPSFVNLTDQLNNVQDVYIDFCHLSPEGNQIMTKAIINHLQKEEI